MPRLMIDGVPVQVADGATLIDAASRAGVPVPALCHHPGLSATGQCRVCMVEVDGESDLVTACSTPARDGMEVTTDSVRARDARNRVFDLLLLNHPLDCPVCDQSGECALQTQMPAALHNSEGRGFDRVELRRPPGPGSRMIGPRVVQHHERCVHCSMCIRAMNEIFEIDDLQMTGRGTEAVVGTFDGSPFDNPWSVCAADVCPVGALTEASFRFKQPAWMLQTTPSICPGCSIGCNIIAGYRHGSVFRFGPRANPEINGWWMCDHGRSLAERLNNRDINRPQIRRNGSRDDLEWSAALDQLSEDIRRFSPTIIASANLSNESLFLAKRLFNDHLALNLIVPVESSTTRRIKSGRDLWIESENNHANATGARLVGVRTSAATDLKTITAQGHVLVLDNRATTWLASRSAASALSNRTIAVVGRQSTPLSNAAPLVLPASSWLETEGTFTSSTGRVQLAHKGPDSQELSLPNWKILSELGQRLNAPDCAFDSPRAVFEDLVASAPAFAGMTYRRLRSEPGTPALLEAAFEG